MNPLTTLMPLVRARLWQPDGKPPADWSEPREASVLKRLLRHHAVTEVEFAILGLEVLRNSGEVNWLKRGAKMTCRALYNTRCGVRDVFGLATDAYWKAGQARPTHHTNESQPVSIAELLKKWAA